MSRFWNLKTQFLSVLVLLLLGALLLQGTVHDLNKDRLLGKVEKLAIDIASTVKQRIYAVVLQVPPRTRVRLTHRPQQGGGRLFLSLELFEDRIQDLLRRRAEGLRDPDRFEREVTLQVQRVVARVQDFIAPRVPEDLEVLEFSPHRTLPEGPRESVTDRGRWVTVGSSRFSGDRLDVRRPRASRSEFETGFGAPSATDSSAEGAALRWAGEDSAAVPAPVAGSAVAGAAEKTRPAEQEIDITGYLQEVQDIFEEYRRADILATMGIFLCGLVAALYFSLRITRPVYRMVEAFDRIAEGKLDTRMNEARGSEFAQMEAQFNRMVESLEDNRRLEHELIQRERVQHMGDLAAGIAHDVRNPLNAIHLNIGQVRDEFLPEEGPARERFLRFTSDAQREVARLNQLVSNFLSLAQPAASGSEPVAPGMLVAELVRLLEKEARSRGVALHVSEQSELPHMDWNRQEMKSAFLNVAMNALQSMEPDGGELRIISGLRGEGAERELVITFADSGRGIPAEDLERVFIPYFTTRKGGTGLGMAIARRIAERFGGRVELRSRVGEGTTVSFAFLCLGPEDAVPTTEAGTA